MPWLYRLLPPPFFLLIFHHSTHLIHSEPFLSPFLGRSQSVWVREGKGKGIMFDLLHPETALSLFLTNTGHLVLLGLFPLPLGRKGQLSGLTSTEQGGMVTSFFLITVFLIMPLKRALAF